MSASVTPSGPAFDLTSATGRADLVSEIRGMVGDHCQADWQRGFPDVTHE